MHIADIMTRATLSHPVMYVMVLKVVKYLKQLKTLETIFYIKLREGELNIYKEVLNNGS